MGQSGDIINPPLNKRHYGLVTVPNPNNLTTLTQGHLIVTKMDTAHHAIWQPGLCSLSFPFFSLLEGASYCVDLGICPSPKGLAEIRAGKVLSNIIVTDEKWSHKREDRESVGVEG